MVITARFSASNRCRNHPEELSNSSWSLVCKICSLGRISTSRMFDILAYISTTRRAMETAAEFCASNRFRQALGSISDCRLVLPY